MRGRGRNTAHATIKDRSLEEAVPRVALDYFFLKVPKKDEGGQSEPSEKSKEEEEEVGMQTMIVMKDESTGEKYARIVAHKGVQEGEDGVWIVNDIVAELKSWGYQGGDSGHLIIKSDGESAIGVVVETIAHKLGGKVVIEKAPKGESQSNGAVEEAGKSVREVAKVLKDALEVKLKSKILPDAVVL